MAGTARAPSSSTGASTGSGSVTPVAVTTSPDTEAIASGLRRGAVIVRASVGRLPSRRAETTSRTVVNTGVRIASWNSSTGATTVASPNTYAATGRPRLPALT